MSQNNQGYQPQPYKPQNRGNERTGNIGHYGGASTVHTDGQPWGSDRPDDHHHGSGSTPGGGAYVGVPPGGGTYGGGRGGGRGGSVSGSGSTSGDDGGPYSGGVTPCGGRSGGAYGGGGGIPGGSGVYNGGSGGGGAYGGGGIPGGSGAYTGGAYTGGAYGGGGGIPGSSGAYNGGSGGGGGGAYGGGGGIPVGSGVYNGGYDGVGAYGGGGGTTGDKQRHHHKTMPIDTQNHHSQFYTQSESSDHERDEDPIQKTQTEMVGSSNYKNARILMTTHQAPPPHIRSQSDCSSHKSDVFPEESVTKEHKFTKPLAVVAVPSKEIMTTHSSDHGKMTGEDAEDIMRKMKKPCYLTRFSKKQNRYVLSLMIEDKEGFEFTHIPLIINNEESKYEIEGTNNPFHSVSTMLGYYEHNILDPTIPNIGIPCIAENPNEIAQDRRLSKKKKILPRMKADLEEEEEEEAACGSERVHEKDHEKDLMETMQKMLEGAMVKAQKEAARGQDQQGPDFGKMLADQNARIEELAEQNRQLLARLPTQAENPNPPDPVVPQVVPQQQPQPDPVGPKANSRRADRKCPIL